MLAVQTCQLFSNIRTDVTNYDDDNVVENDDDDDNDVDDDVDNDVDEGEDDDVGDESDDDVDDHLKTVGTSLPLSHLSSSVERLSVRDRGLNYMIVTILIYKIGYYNQNMGIEHYRQVVILKISLGMRSWS